MKRAKKRRLFRMLCAALSVVLFVFVLVGINKTVEPVASALMYSQGSIICSVAVNEALVEVLSQETLVYGDLVEILRDENGEIVAISTNTAQVNRIKSLLTIRVNEQLAQLPDRDIKIALGTLTGIEWLSGRGPRLPLRMTPTSYAESTLVNLFDSSGINQTRHQILIEFNVTMTAILAPYRVTMTVPVNVCIAETIIVGAVPQMFADFSS